MQVHEGSRWNTWFKNTTYINVLEGIINYVDEKSEMDIPTDYFTPHDSSHCLAVEKLVKALIEKSNIKLSELEIFMLFVSVWTHDIGMLESVAKVHLGDSYSPDTKRQLHDKIAAWFLNQDEQFKSIFIKNNVAEDLFNNYVHTVNIINKYHRREQDVNDCPKERFVKGQSINTRLLACLVRFGDTLHVDSSRYDRKLYNILQIGNFDRSSRLHWLKSYVVSAVYLDINKQTIFVTIDLPESEEPKNLEWEENADRLEFIIREDIYEDVVAVSGTFKDNNLPFYDSVKISTDYCPGFEKERREEVIGILNDLDIVLSPNTSKVIKKSLESIVSLSRMDFKNYEHFYNQTGQLLRHLTKIFEIRPCHVGLGKITKMMQKEFESLPAPDPSAANSKILEFQQAISEGSRKIVEQRAESLRRINDKANGQLADVAHVCLFGYSEMVSNFLSANTAPNFKEDVNLYVFECGGKRQLSSTNGIEYNDGIHYALNLSKAGFKKIRILPETSLASLLSDREMDINKDNSLILFGANGIDETERSCGHTSGHLMMAIVAAHYEIPVKIVADKYKFGRIDWKPHLRREGTNWLTGQRKFIKELRSKNIELINYREDRIPKELIREIICD